MPVTKNTLKTVAKVTNKIPVTEAVIFCICQLFNPTTKIQNSVQEIQTHTHTHTHITRVRPDNLMKRPGQYQAGTVINYLCVLNLEGYKTIEF